jgi:hypothetical protein
MSTTAISNSKLHKGSDRKREECGVPDCIALKVGKILAPVSCWFFFGLLLPWRGRWHVLRKRLWISIELHDIKPQKQSTGWGTMLQAGMSRVRCLIRSLDFSIDVIVPATLWPSGRLSFKQKWVSGIFLGCKGRAARKTDLIAICESIV